MSSHDKYMIDDRIYYCGSRWAQDLANKVGWVIAPIKNQEDSYVVFFEGMKKENDTYVLSSQNIVKIRPAKTDQSGVEIRPRRQSIEQLTEE